MGVAFRGKTGLLGNVRMGLRTCLDDKIDIVFPAYKGNAEILNSCLSITAYLFLFVQLSNFFQLFGPQVKWPQGHPGGAGLPPRAESAAPCGALCGLVGRGPRG